MGDLQTILGSAGIVTLLIATVGGAVKIYQAHAGNRRLDDRDAAERLADFQASAEDHIINYDVPMRERMIQYEALLNHDRIQNGHEPHLFPPLPAPVPLYTRGTKKSKPDQI